MNNKAAIAEVVKVRDQLVIIRERLFQLSAATAAWTREVEGLLIDCAARRPRVRRADCSARLEQRARHAETLVRSVARL
jgi:hypothetical protein